MNLFDLQKYFNEIYHFDKLKISSIIFFEEMITNCQNNYLKEEDDSLPDGLKLKDFIIEYKCVELIINDRNRLYPFFRVCLELLHPETEIAAYYYDIEYSIEGELSDEYFGKKFPEIT
ncbi:hypothetical protein [Paenibacillus sp. MER 99-2]|uniref:hypothetical protein n=1 Tax=Paenibacillus sp. MER 99-2 TaxID=2939572 RepID=UPI00203B5479|nr:hypothetical protein [Paenibacillus sp. MER 99-2]MCM3174143.1 hypothetical protein [Paenibacillus sp. MER 99-2]